MDLSVGVAGQSLYEYSRVGQLFCARAIVTAPVIFSTAAGTGGPLLWNNSAAGTVAVNAVLLGVSIVSTTPATTAAFAIGITGNSGQTSAPTSTTTIDTSANLRIGGPSPRCNVYRVGTPSSAGSFFLPLAQAGTGAITVDNFENCMINLDGSIVVPPGSWVSVAASATATSLVAQVGIIWAEIPV